MDLALFDLDETLISEDSTSLWLRWLVSEGFAPPSLLDEERVLMEHYYQGCLSMEAYMRTTLAPLAGLATRTVEGWIGRFIQRDILPRVYPQARERLEWHRQRGDLILVISASGEHLVNPIAAALGADVALAVGVSIVDERYSGGIFGTITYQQGKLTRLAEWQAEQPHRFDKIWAYSDSMNDAPMLQHADFARVINPAPPLHALAEQHGWEVHRWVR